MGAEYAENTGRIRINYTRGDVLIGASLAGFKYWHIYGEFMPTTYAIKRYRSDDVLRAALNLKIPDTGGIVVEDITRPWR